MTRSIRTHWLTALALLALLSGCTINRDIMFKTSTDQVYDAFADSAKAPLKIQPNDILQFRLFANDGFKIIDLVSEGASRDAQILSKIQFNYNVDENGNAKFPLIGITKVNGLSPREAESMLEDLFKVYYKKPFVQLIVVNRRVVVFPGGGGDARIVSLDNNNTTLFEVLRQVGGLKKRGDARKVKLFRLQKDGGGRDVYSFDMSTIEGLKYADIVMQGDDVVYVQPTPELAREALSDLTPIITLLISIVLVIGIVRGFK